MSEFSPIGLPPDNASRRSGPPDDSASPPSCGPVLVNLCDVQPEPVRWLWPGRIPLGKLTLLVGDPGLGKSLVSLDLAARVSKGQLWPDGAQAIEASGVVLLSAEDDPADTIRPRLDAAGADVERITALTAVAQYDPESGAEFHKAFSLQRHVPVMETAIGRTPDCRLVVIDPISAYLGSVDSHRNAEVRGLLTPLADLAARLGVAIVAVTHLRKNTDGPALYRAMGSLAFVGAARAVWLVTKDKDDPRRRLVLPVKCNNAPDDVLGMAYRIDGGPNAAPTIDWEPDPVKLSADEALATSCADEGRRSAREEAVAWLEDMLGAGPVPAKAMLAAAERDGIKPRTLDRARAELGVVPEREGFAGQGRWVWRLPHRAPPDFIDRQSHALAHNGECGALCPRREAARLIREARQDGNNGRATALLDQWRERLAICIDGGLSLAEAEQVAVTELRSAT